jgi:hypothetical protein
MREEKRMLAETRKKSTAWRTSMTAPATPPIDDDDTPLRLAAAAELAFPGGGMTSSGLRKEAARGRLTVERIAGKDYTTLRAIADMRKLCRLVPKSAALASRSDDTQERVIAKLQALRTKK